MNPAENNRYASIRDYALIGDCHGSALVSRDGSVDWCSLRRFDADPIFCRILDATKGGFFCIQPATSYESQRQYLPATNILRTTFRTPNSAVTVTDLTARTPRVSSLATIAAQISFLGLKPAQSQ